jgi:hypothetical protein
MDRTKKIVTSFLNSAEGYFHTKRVIEDQVKQPRNLYGPMSDRPERWNYTDKRDITKEHLKAILVQAKSIIDLDLYQIIPSVALNAALQYVIHTAGNGKFQSKLDSNIYNCLYKLLEAKMKSGV